MLELVEKAGHISSIIPSWIPSDDNPLATHISNLKIPLVADSVPSLLLHGLGEEVDELDRERASRIPDVFTFGTHTCVSNHSLTTLYALMMSASSGYL
jgi:hypothetical protein